MRIFPIFFNIFFLLRNSLLVLLYKLVVLYTKMKYRNANIWVVSLIGKDFEFVFGNFLLLRSGSFETNIFFNLALFKVSYFQPTCFSVFKLNMLHHHFIACKSFQAFHILQVVISMIAITIEQTY